MVGIPIKVSRSRTYILVVYDEVISPDEVRFIKFLLPDRYPNNSSHARSYAETLFKNQVFRIFDCIPYEEYIQVKQVFDEIKEVKPEEIEDVGVKFSFQPIMNNNGLPQEMKEVRHMLDAWNDEQLSHEISYPEILRNILKDLERKNNLLASIDKLLNEHNPL